jgi:putative DNA primase/helicase
MSIENAINKACSTIGINPPKDRRFGKWLQTDTLSGKKGKGDGRVMINDTHVTAFNWQTGETITVGLGGDVEKSDRLKIAKQIEFSKRKQQADATRAANVAAALLASARTGLHPYLASKGFREERTLVIDASDVRRIGGDYLVPDSDRALGLLVAARTGPKVTSVQLIWEDGTKKFLFGGEVSGASHRISTGVDTWLCEGYATGLSVRAALQGMKVRPTVLCCFSASNIVAVARQMHAGRVFIAAENDKPLAQFGGLGASEYYARKTALPYGMPPDVGTDFNDLHQQTSIFAVQRSLTALMAMRRGAA